MNKKKSKLLTKSCNVAVGDASKIYFYLIIMEKWLASLLFVIGILSCNHFILKQDGY